MSCVSKVERHVSFGEKDEHRLYEKEANERVGLIQEINNDTKVRFMLMMKRCDIPLHVTGPYLPCRDDDLD